LIALLVSTEGNYEGHCQMHSHINRRTGEQPKSAAECTDVGIIDRLIKL